VLILKQASGRRGSPWFVNPAVVPALAPVVDFGFRLVGKQSPLCAEPARVLLHGHRYDGSKAARDLGLEYTPVEDTLERTFRWYRREGLI
jgi:dihydroflavonol-4-reductase